MDKNGLNGLLELAKNLNLDNIKGDLFKLYDLSDEDKEKVNSELEKEGINEANVELKALQNELNKTFK